MLLEINFSTQHNRTSMWIVTPTIIHSWVDATEVYLWIQSLIACDGEDIVGCNIQLQTIQPSIQITEGITQGKVLQTNVRTILDKLI